MVEMKDRQVAEAVNRMKMLGIMGQTIKEFKEEGVVNLSEGPGYLYWLDDDEKKMVKEFEEDSGAVVYHVIKNETEVGTMYSLLYVSKYVEDWKYDWDGLKEGMCTCRVINATDPFLSDSGAIGVVPSIGGLKRVW